jgi:hypothetical protein
MAGFLFSGGRERAGAIASWSRVCALTSSWRSSSLAAAAGFPAAGAGVAAGSDGCFSDAVVEDGAVPPPAAESQKRSSGALASAPAMRRSYRFLVIGTEVDLMNGKAKTAIEVAIEGPGDDGNIAIRKGDGGHRNSPFVGNENQQYLDVVAEI